MNDQRVICGSSLGREYFFGCPWIERECAEAVDSFCGKCNDVSIAEMGRSEIEGVEGLGGGYAQERLEIY